MLDHERKRISLPPIFWKKIGKSTLKIRIHVPLSKGYFKTPPLPCPAALRGVVYKIEAEAKGEYISPSSSVFCAAKYRGSAHRARGLEYKQKQQSPIPPLSGGEVARETEEKGRGLFKRRVTITLLPAVSRSITGCFATQNIGEVSREWRRGWVLSKVDSAAF